MSVRPTLDEVKKSIKQIKTGKAPGLDGIPVELLWFGGDIVSSAILDMIAAALGGFTEFWFHCSRENIPNRFVTTAEV